MSKIAGVGNSSNIFSGQRRDFIVMRKDTFEYTGQIDYVDEDGTDATYDFTSCIGSMAIKKKKNDTTAVRIVSVTFDGVEYTLNVDAEDMDMDAGKYYYDMQIYDANSKMITKMYGDFIVLQDITDFLTIIEEDYEHIFNSNVSAVAVPQEKFVVVITSSVLAELITNASDYYTAILRSSVTASEVLREIMSVVFGSSVSANIIDKYTTIALFGSSITITTYVNQNYTAILGSSIAILVHNTSEGQWEVVPWTK